MIRHVVLFKFENDLELNPLLSFQYWNNISFLDLQYEAGFNTQYYDKKILSLTGQAKITKTIKGLNYSLKWEQNKETQYQKSSILKIGIGYEF